MLKSDTRQLSPARRTLHQAQCLAQGQAKQAFEAQAKLDDPVRESLLAASLTAGRRVPLHILIQPPRQRASGLQRGVVRLPVARLVAPLGSARFGSLTR